MMKVADKKALAVAGTAAPAQAPPPPPPIREERRTIWKVAEHNDVLTEHKIDKEKYLQEERTSIMEEIALSAMLVVVLVFFAYGTVKAGSTKKGHPKFDV